jgi:hypothetical protein
MMIGFNPAFSTSSAVVITYQFRRTDGKLDTTDHLMAFDTPLGYSYNQIIADRSQNQDLAGLAQFSPDPGNRYVQSGTGLVTKISFDNFFDFARDQYGKNIVLNSAELVIEDVQTTDDLALLFPHPSGLALRVLDPNNRLRKYAKEDEVLDRDSILFQGLITSDYAIYRSGQTLRGPFIDNDSTYYAVSDNASGVVLNYNSTEKTYNGFLTLLLQRLYRQQYDNGLKMKDFVLYPTSASNPGYGAKSVNRVVFPSEKVKLRLYYTEPTVN